MSSNKNLKLYDYRAINKHCLSYYRTEEAQGRGQWDNISQVFTGKEIFKICFEEQIKDAQ